MERITLFCDYMKIGSPVTTVLDMVRISMTPGVRISSTPFGPLGSRVLRWMVRSLERCKGDGPAGTILKPKGKKEDC